MSTSALLSALRVGGRQKITASTFGARAQATGSHVLRIHRFSQVREKLANGTAVQSGTFGVGGHDWRIDCYPNGRLEKNQGCISLFLHHASQAKTGDATAGYKLSILDNFWKPSVTLSDEDRFKGNGWGWNQFMKLEEVDKEKHLEDDCLSVLCDVTVDTGLRTEDYTDEVAAAEELTKAPPPFPLHGHGIAEAIWNRQEPDVKIEVGDGQTLAAHRWVLEAGSPVFKADLALAPNDTVAELRVGDMDADVCKALLRFMYTNSLPPELEPMAERLLVAADRYELEELKLACEEALCKNIDTSSVAAILALAERHGCTVLREAGMRFLSSPGNLDVVLASSDGLEKLKRGCPSALLELLEKKRPLNEQLLF
ncbi:BTB/POZ and MATH domain-containing protein 3-like [Lolium rigidum]|uniref:BTB/POZ and MATH domain-containing protein 3-like n=1 Tax=Lolium rigidum TaxID=89674 RepID=UPI001F5C38A3|nr:BTB/POZ and MATH domain-containing protein 3-like [Lolium rigidum]